MPRKGNKANCIYCGGEFSINPARVKPEGNYCSRECQSKAGHVSISCLTCGKEFDKKAARKNEYCSRECAGKGRRKTISVACTVCGKEIRKSPEKLNIGYLQSGDKHYCSQKCKDSEQFVQLECANCGGKFAKKVYRIIPNSKNLHYCSRECFYDTKRKILACEFCGKQIKRPLNKVHNHNYCSDNCARKAKTVVKWQAPILTCTYCGEEFKLSQNAAQRGALYCSKKCAGMAHRKQIDVECSVCGTTFKIPPSRLKQTKLENICCSRECSTKASIKLIQVQCAQCGKVFEKEPSQIGPARQFCSRTCYEKSRPPRVHFTCPICGKDFTRHSAAAEASAKTGKIFYCSHKCQGEAAKNQIEITCEQCGKTFLRWPSQVKGDKQYCSPKCQKEGNITSILVKCDNCGKEFLKQPSSMLYTRNFCSNECRWAGGVLDETKSKLSIITSKQHEERKDFRSKIEFKVSEILEESGIEHLTQKHFYSPKEGYPEGRFGINCDFYIPDLNLVIECNGGYYHADPRMYPDRSQLDERQKKMVFRYERKKRLLNFMNIRLVELWERENYLAEEIVMAPIIILTITKLNKEEQTK